ncbi:MAG: sugar phosphate isomerase/epimerase [Armatimonadetes bacterium]|nr:sugar phosphate isomerase/epimerase [Armatimonadota bacterium]
MQIAMMSYTLARGTPAGEPFDVAGLCALTVELGLQWVDWVTTYEQAAADVHRVMDDHGLRTCCYTFFADLTVPAGQDDFRRGIDTAVALGADKVMLPVAGKPDVPREESFQRYVAGLAEVMPECVAAGVTTTVENFPSPNSPFVVSADVNRAVAELPELRITFDNGNVTCGGEQAGESFTASAPWVVHAHLKDFYVMPAGTEGAFRGLDGRWRRGALLGDGAVDQLATLRAMRAAGYAGCLDIEYEGRELSPREAVVKGVARVRGWLEEIAG